MANYISNFNTLAELQTFSATTEFQRPHTSSINSDGKVYYFCEPIIKIVYKSNGSTPVKIITKNINAFGQIYTLDESSITKMVLDGRKVNFSDFTVIDYGQLGGVYNAYTYTFNDTKEHTLKMWINSDELPIFSPWHSGPQPFGESATITIRYATLPKTITKIGDYVFFSSNLLIMDIPNSVTSIGEGSFKNCSRLTTVKIPNNVTSIGDEAFYACTSLTSIDIPSGVTSIGNSAFYACTSLTSIDIPSGVTSIGNGVFNGCSSLTSNTVNANNTVYDSRNNCNAIIKTETNTLIQGCKTTVIPNSVTSIGRNAFQNCSGLTNIEIPSSVTSIGGYAFDGCSSLASVTIGSGVTSIGEVAFADCQNLSSVTIKATTPPTLGTSTFSSNASGRKIYVPAQSVEAYKSASTWASYINDIEPIP